MSSTVDAERAALVALLRARPDGMTWPQIATAVADRGAASDVWRERADATLFDEPGNDLLARAADDIAAWTAAGLTFVTLLDDDYPSQLRDVHELPPVLFHRGTLLRQDVGVCVVGSRAASPSGIDLAGSVADGLVARGISVVSGLARGIDTAAHVAALAAGGRTVAVIGTGITRHYPAENRALQERIARDGLVLSQFWPDAGPRQQQFPMRNAVMSGYGVATVVVQAGEKSGARIQARQAVAHGRPVVLTTVVVDSTDWARALVRQPGVHVARDADDVLSVVDGIIDADHDVDTLLAAARP